MANTAAAACLSALRAALKAKSSPAVLMLATGNSQLAFYEAFATQAIDGDSEAGAMDWSRLEVFHLDEYVGLPATHTASFVRYLNERFVGALEERQERNNLERKKKGKPELPIRLPRFHALDGAASDPAAEVARYSALLAAHPRDVCCFGIGENGHLAFNVRGNATTQLLASPQYDIHPPTHPRRIRRPWAARTLPTPR